MRDGDLLDTANLKKASTEADTKRSPGSGGRNTGLSPGLTHIQPCRLEQHCSTLARHLL